MGASVATSEVVVATVAVEVGAEVVDVVEDVVVTSGELVVDESKDSILEITDVHVWMLTELFVNDFMLPTADGMTSIIQTCQGPVQLLAV